MFDIKSLIPKAANGLFSELGAFLVPVVLNTTSVSPHSNSKSNYSFKACQ